MVEILLTGLLLDKAAAAYEERLINIFFLGRRIGVSAFISKAYFAAGGKFLNYYLGKQVRGYHGGE